MPTEPQPYLSIYQILKYLVKRLAINLIKIEKKTFQPNWLLGRRKKTFKLLLNLCLCDKQNRKTNKPENIFSWKCETKMCYDEDEQKKTSPTKSLPIFLLKQWKTNYCIQRTFQYHTKHKLVIFIYIPLPLHSVSSSHHHHRSFEDKKKPIFTDDIFGNILASKYRIFSMWKGVKTHISIPL